VGGKSDAKIAYSAVDVQLCANLAAGGCYAIFRIDDGGAKLMPGKLYPDLRNIGVLPSTGTMVALLYIAGPLLPQNPVAAARVSRPDLPFFRGDRVGPVLKAAAASGPAA
jgi:hypothetical protein